MGFMGPEPIRSPSIRSFRSLATHHSWSNSQRASKRAGSVADGCYLNSATAYMRSCLYRRRPRDANIKYGIVLNDPKLVSDATG